MINATGARARASKAIVAAVVVVVLALGASTAAGVVFDGYGRFALGFWARVYAIGVGSAGALLAVALLGGRRSRRIAAGALAALLAAIGGVMLAWNIASGVPMASLEGPWSYPFVVACLVAAALAGRHSAGARRR